MLRPQGVHKAYTRCAQGAVESGEKPGRAHKASTSRPQGVHKKTQQLHFRKDQNWICAHKVSTSRPQGVHKEISKLWKTRLVSTRRPQGVHKASTKLLPQSFKTTHACTSRPQGVHKGPRPCVHKPYTRRTQGVHKAYTSRTQFCHSFCQFLPQILQVFVVFACLVDGL